MPQPIATRGRDDIPHSSTHLLLRKPCTTYRESCEETNVRVVSLRTVYGIYNQCCEKSRKKISDSVSEEDILRSKREMQDHISLAQSERGVYKQCIYQGEIRGCRKRTRTIILFYYFDQLIRQLHFNRLSKCALYIDFAQNVCIPHHGRQMDPLYFLTQRKVQVFEFCNDSVSQQLNYLIDEDQTIGQDGKQTYMYEPNAVISLLDDGL